MAACLYLALTVSLLFTGSCAGTSAQTARNKSGSMSKASQELIALYDQYSAYLSSHDAAVFHPVDPLVRIINDRVLIDAVASGDVNTLKADLVSLGMQHAVAFGRTVSGQLPISAIPAMAALPSLQFARAAAGSTRGGHEHDSPGRLAGRIPPTGSGSV
jgi:hypothetical protein